MIYIFAEYMKSLKLNGRDSLLQRETNCSKYNTINQVIQIDEILIRMRNENGSSKIYQLW